MQNNLHEKAIKLHELVDNDRLSKYVKPVTKLLESLEQKEVMSVVDSNLGDWQERWTPLMKVSDRTHNIDIVKALVRSVKNPKDKVKMINTQNKYGMTAVSVATTWKNWEIVLFLLQNGADYTIKENGLDDMDGLLGIQSPSHPPQKDYFKMACESCATEVVLYYIQSNIVSLSKAKTILDEVKSRIKTGKKQKLFFATVYDFIDKFAHTKISAAWKGYSERRELRNPTTRLGRTKAVYQAHKDGIIVHDDLNANTKQYVQRLQSTIYDMNKNKDKKNKKNTNSRNLAISPKEIRKPELKNSVIISGKEYKVEIGPRGGKFVTVNQRKIYVYTRAG